MLTQLEVSDRDVRLAQFSELMSKCDRDTLILGDLNIINMKIPSNTDEYSQIVRVNNGAATDYDELKKKYNFIDSFDITNRTRDPDVVYSTWTNVIVDYILLKGQGWLDISSDAHYKSFFYFDDSTDHLPIIMDYIDPTVSEYIENMSNIIPDQKFSNAHYDWSLHPFLNLYNPDQKFYNVQPIPAYDWFSQGEIYTERDFIDPYYTGNSQLTFGSDGVYFGLSKKYALNFLTQLILRTSSSDQAQSLVHIGNNRAMIGLLYTFSLKQNKLASNKVAIIHDLRGQTDSNIFDTEADIVTSDYKMNKLKPGPIGKFTSRSKSSVVLDKIDLVCIFDNYQQYDYIDNIAYLMQKAIDHIKNISKDTDYNIVINNYDEIINANNIVKENIYDNIYDDDGKNLNNDVTIYSYSIYDRGNISHHNDRYKKLYMKYKNKYLRLKNNHK